METKKGRYKIVKEMFYREWKFAIMKKRFIGWRYVRCDSIGDIDLDLSTSNRIKYFNTKEQAELAVKNLMYHNEII